MVCKCGGFEAIQTSDEVLMISLYVVHSRGYEDSGFLGLFVTMNAAVRYANSFFCREGEHIFIDQYEFSAFGLKHVFTHTL